MIKNIREDLIDIAKCDLLLYYTDKETGLQKIEEEKWGNILKKTEKHYNFSFKTTRGIMPVEQDKAEIQKVEKIINDIHENKIETFYKIARILGSTLLALALKADLISAEDAFSYSIIDEVWQNEISGYDVEALKRREFMKEEFLKLAQDFKSNG